MQKFEIFRTLFLLIGLFEPIFCRSYYNSPETTTEVYYPPETTTEVYYPPETTTEEYYPPETTTEEYYPPETTETYYQPENNDQDNAAVVRINQNNEKQRPASGGY
jgi:hypothetical protein